MIRRPPRSTRTDTLFPYTTLFRSSENFAQLVQIEADALVGRIGDQDRNQPIGPRDDIGPVAPALALATARLAAREQKGQAPPGCPGIELKPEREEIEREPCGGRVCKQGKNSVGDVCYKKKHK